MPRIVRLRLGQAALLLGLAVGSLAGATSLIATPAHAQVSESLGADFRVALEPYGSWRHHRRFGDVWIPGSRPADWQPYTAGHWVYTDDYGWYWVVNDQEADWGWITCHYGRWYHDAEYGWVWIPGDVWSPAWVDWRYSDDYVGWAPEPPDEVVVADEPGYWSFVTVENFTAPEIATVLLPFRRRAEFIERTVVVNRPVVMSRQGRQFAVNPGIPPAKIAAVRNRPLPTFDVRPHVLAGTAGVPGAIQVRAADLRGRESGNRAGARERVTTRDIVRSSSTVRPVRSAPQPQRLARGEAGRLGETIPRAARGADVVQGAAQRRPETPSAQRGGEQRQTAAPQAGRETEQRRGGPQQRRGNIAPPNAPPSPTAQTPAGPRNGRVERQAGGRERIQPPSAAERRSRERTPVAQTPSGNQGIVQRGPVARPPANRAPAAERPPQMNRPPAVAARPEVNRPPPAARPPAHQPPAFAARPPSRPIAPPRPASPPAAFARPAPPPAAARPAPRPAPPPAAFARPAPPPPAAARPATVGAAPRGGPGQKRPQ